MCQRQHVNFNCNCSVAAVLPCIRESGAAQTTLPMTHLSCQGLGSTQVLVSLLGISFQVFHLSLQPVGGLHVLLEVPLCQLDPVLSLSQGSLRMQADVKRCS